MRKSTLFFITVVFLALIVCPAGALALTIDLNAAFSNYNPGETGYAQDYGTVTLTEGNFSGDNHTDVQFLVDVRLSAGGAGGENADLEYFYFNINPELTGLSITGDGTASPINYDNNVQTYRPDGDGFFDVYVYFGSGSPTVQEATFYVSMNGTDLSIANFADGTAATQSVDGNKGSFTVAAHLQTTSTPAGSEYVGGNPASIPDPAAVFLLGSACLIGFAGVRRKFKK